MWRIKRRQFEELHGTGSFVKRNCTFFQALSSLCVELVAKVTKLKTIRRICVRVRITSAFGTYVPKCIRFSMEFATFYIRANFQLSHFTAYEYLRREKTITLHPRTFFIIFAANNLVFCQNMSE